jgi:hypothetical protein
MRESCARVLAAALMTGAIAGVVGMAALVRTPTEAGPPISAPRSSLQRSVRLAAEPAPRPHRHTVRLVTRHTIHVQARPSVVRPRLAVVRRHAAVRRPARPRQLAVLTPAPQAAPTPPPPAAPADATPEPPPAPTTADPATSNAEADGQEEAEDDGPGHGHGRGHAYGHEQQDD